MDYETINNFLQSPQGELVMYSVVGVTSSLLGFFIGIRSYNRRSLEKELQLSEQITKREQIDLEKIRAQNTIEITKLEYENADKEHARDLEIMAQEQKYKIENENRINQRKLDDEKITSERSEKQQQYKLELANRLFELKPVLQEYIAVIKDGYDHSIKEKRQEMRNELVEEILKDFREGDGIVYEIVREENDIIDEDVQERIENIINARYPQDELPMPFELKRLIDFLFENN